MRILIIEDNSFNAFCLQRLLEAAFTGINVSIIQNSKTAMDRVESFEPDCIILDGDLGAINETHCNGPCLADTIWTAYSHMPLISWTDSETMRHAFASVFEKHGKLFNERNCWAKVVTKERIQSSLTTMCNNYLLSNNSENAYLSAQA